MPHFSLWHHKQKALASGMIKPETTAFSEPLWTKAFMNIWLVNFTISIWFFILNTIFPFYVKHLGGTEMTVGLVAGSFALTAIFMRPIAGWVLDNISRGGFLKYGVIGLAIISVLYLVAPVLSLAVILRLISGFVFAGVGTASNTNACDIIPQSRFGEGMGFLGLGNSLSNALGPALGLMIMMRYGYNVTFVITAILVLVAIAAARGLPYKKIQRRAYLPGHYHLRISDLFNAAAVPASVLIMYAGAAFGGVNVFIALYGEFSGLGSGGIFFLLVALGTGSTRLFSGRLADKKGELPMVVIGNSGFLMGLMLLLFVSSPCYYLSGLFFGLGFGMMFPAMQTMAVRTVPLEKRGAATSTFMCSYDIGAGLGGLAAGCLVTIWGYRPMFGAMTVFVLLSLLTYALWVSKTPAAFKNYMRDRKNIQGATNESA